MRCGLIAAVIGLIATGATGAVRLGTVQQYLSSYPSSSRIDLPLGLYLGPLQGPRSTSPDGLFGPFPVSTRTVTLDLSRDNDPAGWDDLVTSLTDGLDGYLYVGQTDASWQGSATVGREEFSWGLGVPDLMGASIEYIRLTATIYPIHGDVVGDFWFRTSDQTWEIWGTPAPKPSVMTLMAAAGTLMLCKRVRGRTR